MDSIVLSKKITVSTDTRITGLNNNICMFGPTGSGKTCSFIIPLILKNFRTNQIIYDPKGELHDKYRPLYESRGTKVYQLNLSDPKKSDVSLDPLSIVSSDDDISMLAEAIVNLTPQRENSSADRYWEDAAAVLAKFGLYYVIATENDANFADFLDFIIKKINIEEGCGLIKTSVDQHLEVIKKKHPDHPMIEPYDSLKVLPIKTAGCVFSELRTTLTAVFNPSLKEMFRTQKSLDFKQFASEPSVLFITANGANKYLTSYVNMLLDICINEFTKIADQFPNQALPIPLNFVMEDFGCNGGAIRSFPDYIAKFRSKAMSAVVILQDQSQLKAKYDEYGARTIMNNCDTMLYLGGSDKDTAKDMAERLNVPLEKVLYMPLGEIIVFRRGSYPCIDQRYPTLEDDEYKKAALLAEKKRKTVIKVQSSIQDNKTVMDEADEEMRRGLERKFDELFGPVE